VQAEFRRLSGWRDQLSGGLAAGDLQRLRARVVDRLHSGLVELVRSRGIEIVEGRGRLIGPSTVTVADQLVEARCVVVATGSLPRQVATVPADGELVVTSDQALGLDRIPASPVVIGAGAVGIEFASLWADLGASVTIVEIADRLLPLEDEASSAFLAQMFKRRGITLHLARTVTNMDRVRDRARLQLDDRTVLESDLVLVATGRTPNTVESGAVELGLTDSRGFINADPYGRTQLSSVWGVGDVLPTLALVHAAFAEGFVVADQMAGIPTRPVDYHLVPRVTYSHPEVASVGLTERQARSRHADAQVTVTSMAGNARVVIEGGTGQVKLVTTGDGELLGVHVVGPLATELISEATLATSWGALVEEAAEVVHPHPTVSETLREAALGAAGLPFHAHIDRRLTTDGEFVSGT
jgi:dihydrolipoamide dehydrogenase